MLVGIVILAMAINTGTSSLVAGGAGKQQTAMLDGKQIATPDELKQARIENRTVILPDIFDGIRRDAPPTGTIRPLIEGRTLINCNVHGPAMLLLENGTTIMNPTFSIARGELRSASKALFLEVPDPAHTYGALVLDGCTLADCEFANIIFLGAAGEIEEFRAAVAED